MTSSAITESVIEEAALAWFNELGYEVVFGPSIAPEEPNAERLGWDEVVLRARLRAAIERINRSLPDDVLDDVVSRVCRIYSPSPVANNQQFHQMLVKGVDVEYRAKGGCVIYDKAWLVDFENPDNNNWLACNQFTVIESGRNRRADVVVFVNGLPLALFELKNPADESATLKAAFNQLQTYKKDIPSLFQFNELMLISDSLEARSGTLTSNWERFMPWRTVDGTTIAPKAVSELSVTINGMFEKRRLLDLIRHFVVFQRDDATLVKKLAGYHQFHAVNKAVQCTIKASRPKGDKRIGVIWHTQGSGKSLTMAFYAGKIVKHPTMTNPTLVIITDRNDLDDQLFGTFAACEEIIGQKPTQAEDRDHLQELLKVASGGVIFTTIQKFLPEKNTRYPLLSDRRNIVVIADEAHRSQYDFIDGFARHMRDALPNASFVGFTGTPIERADKSTPAVFGDYIDTYDIQRAVEDGATVPIYYEGRLAKIELRDEERPRLDPEFEELTEREEVDRKEQLKSKWARLEALVGTEKRINLIARDIVTHFENRSSVLKGKAMIVCMSRRICVEIYDAIVRIRPNWHDNDDLKGAIKVVMTGSASDPLPWQDHIRNKPRREDLAARFKKPKDPLKVVIVRDMWLTGFDVPCLHTMYVDKPMRGHGLMQAIARVNRVFSNKPGGLVVDYLGLADQLKKALSEYSEGSREEAGVPIEDAVAVLQEKFEIVSAMFHGFDYSDFMSDSPVKRTEAIPKAMEHILSLDDGRSRYMTAVTDLSKAFALSVPHESALAMKDDVGFFQTVRSGLAKTGESDGSGSREDIDAAIRQLVSRAVASEEVVDIFRAAGLKNPDISILSDEFLSEIQGLPHRNLAIEVLKKLLGEAIARRAKTHLIEARSFREMLEKSIKEDQNRSIEAAAVIQHLIELAKEMRQANARGEKLGLTEDELAFYDALEVNDSAVKILGDEILRAIARDLVETVKRNVTIDWTVKESVRANLRRMVKRVLKEHGYPPDKQEKAVQTVLEQAETLCEHWAA